MEMTTLKDDVKLGMVRAGSFPMGVMAAHNQLHEKVAGDNGRGFYGISWPDKQGNIMYWAAAEELQPGEFAGKDLEPFTLVKGNYLYIDVKNYMKDKLAIGNAFQIILKDHRIAHDGCCVEQYFSDTDCRCMVRIQ